MVSSLATARPRARVAWAAAPIGRNGRRIPFTAGACGDPSPTSGVFWTRVIRGDGQQGDIPVVLELSRTPDPRGENSFRLAMTIPVVAKQENDYIIHHKVTGLEPDTIYYFSALSPAATGATGRPVPLAAQRRGRGVAHPVWRDQRFRLESWPLGRSGCAAEQFPRAVLRDTAGRCHQQMIPVAGSNRLTEPVHEMHLPD